MPLTSYAKGLLEKKPRAESLIYVNTPAVESALAARQEAGRAEINLGHACPHRCIFCMQGHGTVDQKQWLPLDKLKTELEYYRHERGFTRLGFLGGEPTLYPWLMEGLDHAKALGFDRITINSNGYRFADMDFAREAVRRGLTRFCLSVHGHTVAVEDTCSGSADSLVRKVNAIRNLHRLKREGLLIEGISLNPVLNRLNMTDLPGFVEFFLKLQVQDIRFNYIRPEGRAAESREIVPSFTEAMPYIVALILRNETTWKADLTFGEVPFCAWPDEILGNATLRRRYIGEFRDTRTIVTSYQAARRDDDGKRRFVWQELKANVLKTLTPACRRCANRDACGGVWRNYATMYGTREFHPVPAIEVAPDEGFPHAVPDPAPAPGGTTG